MQFPDNFYGHVLRVSVVTFFLLQGVFFATFLQSVHVYYYTVQQQLIHLQIQLNSEV